MDPTVTGDIQAAIDLAKESVGVAPRITMIGKVPVALAPPGTSLAALEGVLNLNDKLAENPRAREGVAILAELESFIAHVNRYRDEGSVIFADIAKMTLTAIYDYHPADVPGGKSLPRWCKHRATYQSLLSRQWQLWTRLENAPLTQDQFADVLEQNMGDLASVEGATEPAKMLEIARFLVIKQKGEFSRSVNPTTGEYALTNKSENDVGSTTIPRSFMLGLPVFEAGALYQVEARIRFAMKDSKPTFSYFLFEKERLLRDAFNEVRDQATKGTGVPILAGVPEKA
jgi:uncharacterized protein YfdQ (DUF2303 family)